MLRNSDTNVKETLALFNRFEAGVALVVPTATGLRKSIIDATKNARTHFDSTGFHDYFSQAQGTGAKQTRKATLVYPDCFKETKISLYRPETKSGDPRLWIYGLKAYAKPGNLIAIYTTSEEAFVINCSESGNRKALADPASRISTTLMGRKPYRRRAVDRLIEMITAVSQKGFVPSLRTGSTGVGMTLETHLGIRGNSSQEPDFHGIEIKAKRLGRRTRTRSTLFSQAPNWKLSPIGSAWKLLSTYGYHRNGKLRLNHQMDALKPNSLGFILQVDDARGWLKQNHLDKESRKEKHVVTWLMEHLHKRLRTKHPETFWVGAESRTTGGSEEFRYVEILHTKKPMVSNFDVLLETGIVSVDYLMSEKPNQRVRDHGYLFKVHQEDFDLLFPPPEIYDLR